MENFHYVMHNIYVYMSESIYIIKLYTEGKNIKTLEY